MTGSIPSAIWKNANVNAMRSSMRILGEGKTISEGEEGGEDQEGQGDGAPAGGGDDGLGGWGSGATH